MAGPVTDQRPTLPPCPGSVGGCGRRSAPQCLFVLASGQGVPPPVRPAAGNLTAWISARFSLASVVDSVNRSMSGLHLNLFRQGWALGVLGPRLSLVISVGMICSLSIVGGSSLVASCAAPSSPGSVCNLSVKDMHVVDSTCVCTRERFTCLPVQSGQVPQWGDEYRIILVERSREWWIKACHHRGAS